MIPGIYAYTLGPSDRDTWRHMSPDEMEAYYVRDLCPFCGESALNMLLGPRGGLSRNVECPRCEGRLNVIVGIPRGILYVAFGQVIRNPRPERLA